MVDTAEQVWEASEAQASFAEVFEAAMTGAPQVLQRRDGREVVVVSRDYYDRTRPSLKAYLLANGYAGDEEDAFDRAMRDIREGPPIPFAPRDVDLRD